MTYLIHLGSRKDEVTCCKGDSVVLFTASLLEKSNPLRWRTRLSSTMREIDIREVEIRENTGLGLAW